METLQSLVKIISLRKLSKVEILDKSLISSKGSVLSKFYYGIINNSFQTDHEAIEFLYGIKNEENTKNYRQLKARFKKRLLNTLFFIDVNNKDYETEVQRQYFECTRSIQEINIIQKYGGNQHLVFAIISDLLPIAEKYEFYDILEVYYHKLITYYSVGGNCKKIEEIIQRFNSYRNAKNETDNSYILFSEINCFFAANAKFDEDHYNELKENLEKQTTFVNTYLSICYNSLSWILILEHEKKTNALNNECDKLLAHLETKDNAFRQSFKGIVNMYKINTLLQFRELEKGIEYIDQNLHNLFGINWYEAMATKLRFALNQHNFILSKEIIKEVYSQKAFKSLPSNIIEKWYILEGYTAFFEDYITGGNYNYKVAKLINQVPYYYHDKSGFNFSIIILQLLFSIAKNDIDQCSQIVQSLKIYKSRYFKSDIHVREVEFIKSLFILDKCGFNINKLNILYKNFSYKVSLDAKIMEHEIICYDLLITIILDLIQPKIK